MSGHSSTESGDIRLISCLHSYGEGFSIISRMIGATTAFANLPVQLAKYEAFAAKAHQLRLTAIEASIRLKLPKVRSNVYWRQHLYYELEKYLRELVTMLKIAD